MFLKLYITINKNNNLHLNVIDKKGFCLFKKSYGCVDKSSKLKLNGVQKLFNQVTGFIEKYKNPNLVIVFNGPSVQRFLFLKDFLKKQFFISKIFYVSQFSFNGCRKKKQRRLLFLRRMSEWFKVPVLKTGRIIFYKGSNPFSPDFLNFL